MNQPTPFHWFTPQRPQVAEPHREIGEDTVDWLNSLAKEKKVAEPDAKLKEILAEIEICRNKCERAIDMINKLCAT